MDSEIVLVAPGEDVIAAISNARPGGVVHLLEGDHYVGGDSGGGAVWEGLSNVTIRGDGRARTRVHATSSWAMRFDRCAEIHIRHLSVHLSDEANFRRGLVFVGCRGVVVDGFGAHAGPATEPLWTPMGILAIDSQGVTIRRGVTSLCQIKVGGWGAVRDVAIDDIHADRPVNFAVSVVCGSDGAEMSDVVIRDIYAQDVFSSGALFLGHDDNSDNVSTRQENVLVEGVTVRGSWPDILQQSKIILCRVGPAGWDGLTIRGVDSRIVGGDRKWTSGILVAPRSQGGQARDVELRDIHIDNTDHHGLVLHNVHGSFSDLVLQDTRGVEVTGESSGSGSARLLDRGSIDTVPGFEVHRVL